MVDGGASHIHPSRGLNRQVGVTTAPGHGLLQQIALAIEGLLELAAGIHPAHQLHPPFGHNRKGAALAAAIGIGALAKTSRRQAAAAVDQQAQGIGRTTQNPAVPAIVRSRNTAAQG